MQLIVHCAGGAGDIDPEVLANTPGRFMRALEEMTEGYKVDPEEVLSKRFEDPAYNQVILLRDVDFVSLCEHHLLPFVGKAHVGYIPSGGSVVGLSKLARLVECFARRFQIQERMTQQIADSIWEALSPVGVGVVVEAAHECMACRGVKKAGAKMVTSALYGQIREDASTRAEFLAMCGVSR